MSDAHEAAVEALATALAGEMNKTPDGFEPTRPEECVTDALAALAALTSSEAVRAALDGGLNRVLDESLRLSGGVCERMDGKCCSYHEGFGDALDQAADAILAALAGEAT